MMIMIDDGWKESNNWKWKLEFERKKMSILTRFYLVVVGGWRKNFPISKKEKAENPIIWFQNDRFNYTNSNNNNNKIFQSINSFESSSLFVSLEFGHKIQFRISFSFCLLRIYYTTHTHTILVNIISDEINSRKQKKKRKKRFFFSFFS